MIVIPAQAGIQRTRQNRRYSDWIPTFAGMTTNTLIAVKTGFGIATGQKE